MDKIFGGISEYYNLPQNTFSLSEHSKWVLAAFRGKSPVYKDNTAFVILNQKCNRWNYIDEQFAKTVDAEWYHNLNKDIFLKENDIIINSTGEGTLGRASLVTSRHEGFLVDSHMLVLRLDTKYISPDFMVRQINCSYGQKQIDLLKGAQATKQTELGVDNLLKFKFIIPLDKNGNPNLQIQNAIVNYIIKIENEIVSLEKEVDDIEIKAKQDFENAIFKE